MQAINLSSVRKFSELIQGIADILGESKHLKRYSVTSAESCVDFRDRRMPRLMCDGSGFQTDSKGKVNSSPWKLSGFVEAKEALATVRACVGISEASPEIPQSIPMMQPDSVAILLRVAHYLGIAAGVCDMVSVQWPAFGRAQTWTAWKKSAQTSMMVGLNVVSGFDALPILSAVGACGEEVRSEPLADCADSVRFAFDALSAVLLHEEDRTKRETESKEAWIESMECPRAAVEVPRVAVETVAPQWSVAANESAQDAPRVVVDIKEEVSKLKPGIIYTLAPGGRLVKLENPAMPAVGTRLRGIWGIGHSDTTGTIVAHTIRGGSMGAEIVDEEGTYRWTDRLRQPSDLSPIGWRVEGDALASGEGVAALIAQAEAKKSKKAIEMAQEETRQAFAIERGRDVAQALIPSNAQALIIAELREDDSDSQSDYYGHTTARRVVLAWSAHGRDLFPELRKAAARFAETAGMAIDGVEHREKYSMGGGRHHGWIIKKVRICPNVIDLATLATLGEVHALGDIPAAMAPVVVAVAPASAPVEVVAPIEPEPAAPALLVWSPVPGKQGATLRAAGVSVADLRAVGFKWGKSLAWEAEHTPAAAAILARILAGGTEPTAPAVEPVKPEALNIAVSAQQCQPVRQQAAPVNLAKVEALATSLEALETSGNRPRDTHTPKKLKHAQEARREAAHAGRAAALVRAWLASPDHALVMTKAAVLEATREEAECVSNGYHGYHRDTGRPAKTDNAAALALRARYLAGPVAPRQVSADELADRLRFVDIDGFFPTPATICRRVVDAADIRHGMTVVEPSAGKGDLALAARAAGAVVTVAEVNGSLREVLAAHGWQAQEDMFEVVGAFDRVVMNPPFERGQDQIHVRHAFDSLLAPGGRLVAIVSAGSMSSQRAAVWRDWLALVGAEVIDLPEDAFSGSDAWRKTGVRTCMVTIDKPAGES
jgi:hypothetical protein